MKKRGKMIKFSTFRTTSVYSIPSKLSVVELIDVSIFDILNTGWVVTWFLLGYTVRKNGGLLSTPMF